MTRMIADFDAIRRAARLIAEGGLVVFPTETVYGLGADALNPYAVAKIFQAKKRPRFDPIIVHIDRPQMLERLCERVPESAAALVERFWPGPLTIVLPKKDIVPGIVTAGLNTVAVRIPAHPVALDLLRESATPIAAPSANPFEYLSPTSAEQIVKPLEDAVDLILDAGPCEVGLESTIVDFSRVGPAVLLRPGGLSLGEIEGVIGPIMREDRPGNRPRSPGQFVRHYAPRTRLVLVDRGRAVEPAQGRTGYLAFQTAPASGIFHCVEILSPNGDLREAAARFFQCLHRLDHAGLDRIYAEAVPEEGLGLAMMNRLRKAADTS